MDDRRREPRELLTLTVAYADASELVTDNISTGGTFVLTERLLPEGAEIRLVLSFPGLLKALPVNGRVKWTRAEPPEMRGVGVAFDRSACSSSKTTRTSPTSSATACAAARGASSAGASPSSARPSTTGATGWRS